MEKKDGRRIKLEKNIELKGNIKNVVLVLAVISLVIGTIYDMVYTMLDYRNFSGFYLLQFGARLAQVIILFKLSDHAELLTVPILAEGLPKIYFWLLPWIGGQVYTTMLPPLAQMFRYCFLIILPIAIIIFTYKPSKPKVMKIINIVCILCPLYTIISTIISTSHFAEGSELVVGLLTNSLWIMAVKCLVVAIAFLRADYVEPKQYDLSKVRTASNMYFAITVFVGAIMMFYGMFIIAAGTEIRSYVDIFGDTQVYAADRTAPYVYSCGAMIAITYVLKKILLKKLSEKSADVLNP